MKTTLFAMIAALPLMAQDGAPQGAPGCPPPADGAPKCACKCGSPHARKAHEARKAAFMEKFDTNKDGKIDEQEKEAIKAAREARKAEFEKKMLEKYDVNKDGKLDDEEKAAAKADFMKRHHHGPKHHGARPHGPKPGCCCGGKPTPEQIKAHEARKAAFMEKFDTNKDGKIDEQEKEAIKAAFAARKAEFEKKMLEKYDVNKDGKLDDEEKAAAKADFMKHRHHGPKPGCGGPKPERKPGCGGPRRPHGPKPGCCPKQAAPAESAPAPEAPQAA